MRGDISKIRRTVCRAVEGLPGGWCELARRSGHERTALWRAFKGRQYENRPGLVLLLDVLPHLGLRLELTES